tara:strand:- start:1568 stop:1984 length:417 start_codon:yes stop_codon:yes gene_type:complete
MPSDSILEKWVEEGMDHEEIQQKIKIDFHEDVALSSVSGHLSRIGATNRIKYSDWIPWARISLDHNHHYTLNMLRIGARIDRGLQVRGTDKRRFDRWSTELQEKKLVVHYDYDTMEGFFYVKRRPKVDSVYIRNPRKP